MARRPKSPRCPATCWKGAPDNPLAIKAQCVEVEGHPGKVHEDENGNRFTGTGEQSALLIIR